VHTNTGDFVRIAGELGVPLHGMGDPWMAPIPLELLDDEQVCPVFVTPGDSMIFVNRHGNRTMNEKGSYNEVARVFGTWDPGAMEYPNLVMMMIFDDRVRELWGPPEGYDEVQATSEWPLVSLGDYSNDDRVVISGPDLPGLADAVDERLRKLTHLTGGLQLHDGFVDTTRRSIERFNSFAQQGLDDDFARGQKPIERMWAGEHRVGNELPDPTMFPLSADGPLHAIILAAGTLDTRGGPRINPDGQVLDSRNTPVRGLYGAGNCVASPFVQGYPAGGVPNGSAMIFGYSAGVHAGLAAGSQAEQT
jgi:succinate dehydrogenase/fumarate reductase flavoprotein subunit